jgi:hypothetical protein
MNLLKVWHQEAYQGTHRKNGYFEGWYLKMIDATRGIVFALIPGVSIRRSKADSHAFIQLINAITGKTEYFRFPFEDFSADSRKFDVWIGNNHFWDGGIEVDLRNETMRLAAKLRFENIEKYPASLRHPGIMGPFSFVPGMECYHGIVNIRHTISGSMVYNGMQLDMTGGEGYIEKDWGSSFPQAWIWMQANHFASYNASFMFSVARIPWLGTTFTGLICFLRTDGGFYRFATYNGGKICAMETEGDQVKVRLRNPSHNLAFTATYSRGGILKAPKNGLMLHDIEESITAHVAVELSDHQGNVLFQDESNHAGMEIAGQLDHTAYRR